MSWEHAADVRQALHAIVTDPDYGAAALSSTRIMTNLLNDMLPDAPREKSVLIGAADARIAEILIDRTGHGLDPSLAINQAASSLAAATVFPRDVCDWVATELAVALGIIAGQELPQHPGPGQGPDPDRPGPGPGDGREATTTGRGGTRREDQGRRDQDDVTIVPDREPATVPEGGGPERRQRGLSPRLRTTLIAGGGLVAAAVVVIAIAAWPSPAPPLPHKHHHHTSPSPSPSPSPTPSPSVEALTTIMNPAGAAPVATACSTAPLQGLDPATLTSRLYCTHAAQPNVVVWAYQFDSSSDYQAGVGELNKTLKFNPATASKSCPPPSGHSNGDTGWKSGSNYPDRTGQNIECYTAGGGEPVIVWTMPSQDVIFLAEYKVKGTPMTNLIAWWKTTTYG
jgi:hypothetical protein